ncbi:MAG TPA: hypothetical protein VM143_07420 [Acidimicrobiales bacterium]|nr:hypothetical protein [Acidimicrobiales bacterium]
MASLRMVHLLTVASVFQARVLAARLGSEGIVVSLRGAIDGPYPFGDVFVDVDEDGFDLARQLLLADEVEEAFAPRVAPTSGARSWAMHPWVAVGTLILMTLAGSFVRLVSI